MELHLPLILDGATGTQLQKRGYSNGFCAEQWVLDHPDVIQEIQKDYIAAGSNIIYAPTFSANSVKLEENHIFNAVEDMNLRLVALSKAIAEGKAYVGGDIAPIGKFLAPLGDISFEEMYEIYLEQAAALEKAGVDLFAIETQTSLPEARAAVLAIKAVSQKPIFVTFSCDESGKSLTGTDVTAALVVLQGMGIDAFGLNCSTGPDKMIPHLRRLSEYAEVPLIAKPNAGMPVFENGKAVYHCPPSEFAAYVDDFAEAGVAIFGGCCGTEAGHIRILSEMTKGLDIKRPAPKYEDLLPLATEKETTYLPVNATYDKVIACGNDLSDEIEEGNEDASKLLAIRISSEADLDYFADCQISIRKPLCILCDDVNLLEQALRVFQGRALYEGSIPESDLKVLQKKYGLVY